MSRTINTKLKLEGEAEYRASVKNINSELSAMKSELAAVESKYRENANSVEALAAKQEVLQKRYDAQNEKLSLTNEQLGKAKNAYAQSGDKVETYKTKLSEAEKELSKMQASTEDTSEEQAKLTKEIQELQQALGKEEEAQQKAANTVQEYQKQVNNTQVTLDKFGDELNQNADYLQEAESAADGCATSIDKFGKETEQAKNKARDFGDKIKDAKGAAIDAGKGIATAFAAAAASAVALVEGTEEIRRDFSKLEQNGKNAGVSMKELKNHLVGLQAVTGETDSSIEALSNLLATNLSGKGLTQAVDDLTGAVIKFPDTLKIESLADSLQETIATGAATGQFGELLERLGMNLDDFNAKMGAASDQTQRQELALQTLASTGLASVAQEYRESNGALTEYASAQLDLQLATAKLGEVLTPLVAGGMNGMAEALEWVSENTGPVAVGISAVTTAYVAYKVATAAATIATQVFDKALNTTKVGLIVSLVAGAVGAIGGLIAVMSGVKTEADELQESLESAREEHEKNMQSIQEESAATLGLITTLQTLIATQGETAAGKAQIQSIVSELNAAIPNLSLAYNEQTNSLNMTAQAVRDLAAAEYERAKQQAQQEALIEAYKTQFQIEEQLTEAKLRLIEAENAYNAAKSESGPLTANLASEYNKSKSEVDKYTLALEENGNQIESMGGVVEGYTSALEEHSDANQSAEETVDSLKAQLETLQAQYEENRKACKASLESQMGLFDEVAKSSTTSMEKIISNLEKQAKYWTDYDTNFSAVMKKLESYPPEVRDAIVKNLSDGSDKSAAILAAMATATPKEMERMVAGMNQREKTMAAAASTMGGYVDGVAASKEKVDAQYKLVSGSVAVMNQKTGAYSAGSDTASGFISGLGSLKDKVIAKSKEIALAATSAMKKFLGINSPSKVFAELGKFTIDGYIVGLDGQKGNMEAAATRAADILLKTFGKSDKAKAQIDAFMDTYKDYLSGVAEEAKEYADQLEKTLGGIQSQWDDVDKQRQSMQEKLSGYGSLMGDDDKFLSTKEALAGLDEAYKKAYESARSSVDGQMGLFKRMSASADRDFAELFSNMNSQAAFANQYATNLQKAVDFGMDQTLLEKLADGSEGSAKILDALVRGEFTVDQANETYARLNAEQDALASVMANINKGGKDGSQLSSLQSQIDTLDKYKGSLDALKERGISNDLIQQVVDMNPDDAIAYAEELLSLSDEKWEEYNALWAEKQQKAAKIAEDYYKEEMDALETEYSDQLQKGMDGLKDITFSSGQTMVQSLIAGMKSQESALQNQASALANLVKGAINGGDLSFVGSHKNGLSYVPYDDYPAMLHEGERVLTKEEAQEYLYRSIPTVIEVPGADNRLEEQRRTEAVVNALSTITTGFDQRNKGDMTIQMIVDGSVFARATIENFRAASDERPRVESDFV